MGTAGWVRGGRFDRSRVRWEPLLDDRERLGLVGASWGDCWGDCIVGFGGLFGLVVVMVVMMVVVMVVMVEEEEEEEWLVGWRFWGGVEEMTATALYIRGRSGTETPPAGTKASANRLGPVTQLLRLGAQHGIQR